MFSNSSNPNQSISVSILTTSKNTCNSSNNFAPTVVYTSTFLSLMGFSKFFGVNSISSISKETKVLSK